MPRTFPGGPHERGENLLTHRPTLTYLGALAAHTTGSILEIGTGTGLLTRRLAELGRPLTTIDVDPGNVRRARDRKSTRLNFSHVAISYAVFCLKKKKDTATDELPHLPEA